MCFKRGAWDISFLFVFMGEILYTAGATFILTFNLFNVRSLKINISGFQVFYVLYNKEVIRIHETSCITNLA